MPARMRRMRDTSPAERPAMSAVRVSGPCISVGSKRVVGIAEVKVVRRPSMEVVTSEKVVLVMFRRVVWLLLLSVNEEITGGGGVEDGGIEEGGSDEIDEGRSLDSTAEDDGLRTDINTRSRYEEALHTSPNSSSTAQQVCWSAPPAPAPTMNDLMSNPLTGWVATHGGDTWFIASWSLSREMRTHCTSQVVKGRDTGSGGGRSSSSPPSIPQFNAGPYLMLDTATLVLHPLFWAAREVRGRRWMAIDKIREVKDCLLGLQEGKSSEVKRSGPLSPFIGSNEDGLEQTIGA